MLVLDSEHILYIDDDHLSYYGTQQAKGRITDSFKKLIFKGS